ncbi:hydrolase [Streptomyces hainanensis]|uniref:Hydrolase n=2 Tax=Streptomyces hainanensis TaxID=402648 RepID=A0A4R4TNK9_9ACTN|nr:amidohydrolase family protein [Streptomyces hainanensis]TDC79657.1 hydrolase [Streptomyces hainanensis]
MAMLTLRGPRLADGRTVDLLLSADRIEAVGTPGSLTPPAGAQEVDLAGYLLLPAPAEPHAHHDTALTGVLPGPPAGTPVALRRRITEAALTQLGHGATAQRSHVRIGGAESLAVLEAALETARTLRGLAELGVVAVPRLLTGLAGADNRALLTEAAKMGAGALGGSPDLDPDPAGYLDIVLGLADEHGCAIDLHTDGADPVRLARLASAAGACRSGVAIGPCGGLSRLPPEVAARAAGQLAAAGVTVICLPPGSCGLATARGRAPVRLLTAAGVRVAAGGGALRDSVNPVGRGDPLDVAHELAARGVCRPRDAYRAVSDRARAALGLPEVRIEAGFPAELLAVRGRTVADALSLAYSRLVIHRGRIVARTSAVREYCGAGAAGGPELPRQSTGY